MKDSEVVQGGEVKRGPRGPVLEPMLCLGRSGGPPGEPWL